MSWNLLSEDEKRRAEERFTGLSIVDNIRQQMLAESRERRYGFGDVYQFATNAHIEMTSGLQKALKQDDKLQSALDQLLSERVVYQFPRAAAASSGNLESREGDGFSIQIKHSRAQSGQVYIILKMEDAFQQEPTAITLKSGEGQYLKKLLPLSVDGVFQFLAEEDDEFVKTLRDVASEVFLNS
ncbi:hypothetical protein [Curvivirga aplysinae]|uniref:hypothetical protein n=1 Tax=Curvivirga aplysinae TaxID=2529852 RepID=UPI0012BD6134|nr:hypothetical protein [Curvivirga aplysinae]MTI08728.1 hypothetical protein [Curvivirga aplysinae]